MDSIKAARISHLIIEEMAKGKRIQDAIDAVLGVGTWQRIVDETYDALVAKTARA